MNSRTVKKSGNSVKRYLRTILSWFGLRVQQSSVRVMYPPDPNEVFESSYIENPEVGARNLSVKLQRVVDGGEFEWPEITRLNATVVNMIGTARRIVELGSGTGLFAWLVSEEPNINVVASEFDGEASAWAAKNRSRPNIRYVPGPVTEDDGPFDLLVSIEVIEHVGDYRGFLETCASLAPRALITTPNKNRSTCAEKAAPPPYYQHTREWTAGEFYWVLRTFYNKVEMYTMSNSTTSGASHIQVTDWRTPLIADCSEPIRSNSSKNASV